MTDSELKPILTKGESFTRWKVSDGNDSGYGDTIEAAHRAYKDCIKESSAVNNHQLLVDALEEIYKKDIELQDQSESYNSFRDASISNIAEAALKAARGE